jgi:hypothetical protein
MTSNASARRERDEVIAVLSHEGLDKGAKFTARFKIDDSATEAGGDERPIAAKDAGPQVMAA